MKPPSWCHVCGLKSIQQYGATVGSRLGACFLAYPFSRARHAQTWPVAREGKENRAPFAINFLDRFSKPTFCIEPRALFLHIISHHTRRLQPRAPSTSKHRRWRCVRRHWTQRSREVRRGRRRGVPSGVSVRKLHRLYDVTAAATDGRGCVGDCVHPRIARANVIALPRQK